MSRPATGVALAIYYLGIGLDLSAGACRAGFIITNRLAGPFLADLFALRRQAGVHPRETPVHGGDATGLRP